MSDKKMIKLEKIKYKNEEYQIFADTKGRRIFLKIKNDNTYIYPEIKIYLELDQIYNHKDITLVYSKKDIKRKLIEGTLIVANITLLSLNVYNLVKDNLIENKMMQSYQSYNRIDYNTAISLAYQSEDVFEILKSNRNLTENEKKYIIHFINYLQEEKPYIDLSIFKANLKNLKIVKKETEEFNKTYNENTLALFSPMENSIFYKEKLSPETLYHELGHLLNVIYFEDKNLFYHVEGENNFKEALFEGFNSLFTSEITKIKSNAYYREQCYIKILNEIIGNKKLEECYFSGEDIIEVLSEYDNIDEVKRTIMLMDDLCTTDNIDNIDSKETKKAIARKLLEWSRISAKKKFDELKNQNVDKLDLEQAYFYQLLNTDILLSQAFGYDRNQIKELEKSFKDDSDIFKKYNFLLNDDAKYLEKIIYQNNFLENRKYFVFSTEQMTFEKIEELSKDHNQTK